MLIPIALSTPIPVPANLTSSNARTLRRTCTHTSANACALIMLQRTRPRYASTCAPSRAPTKIPIPALITPEPTPAVPRTAPEEAANPQLQIVGAAVASRCSRCITRALRGFFFEYRYCSETDRGFHGGKYTGKPKHFPRKASQNTGKPLNDKVPQ